MSKTSIGFSELLRRRVPQALVAYLVGAWGVLQFVEFLEGRYRLSPAWVDLSGALFLLLIPSVLTWAWSQGAPGRDPWTRRQFAVVGGNLVAAAAILLTLAGPRDLGAVTTRVVIENEDGETQEREVPREAFRVSVTNSFPTPAGTDEDAAAWSSAWTTLLETTLFQNPFVNIRSAWLGVETTRRAGLKDPRWAPRALIADLAERQASKAYATGRLFRRDERWQVELELRSTSTDQSLGHAVFDFTPTEIFETVDTAARWFLDALDVPRVEIEGSDVRPVADLTTESTEALREWILGTQANVIGNDPIAAEHHLRKAVEIDPTFAFAHLQLYGIEITQGHTEAALAAVDAAMQHAYRLSERAQFLVRASYFGGRNDVDRAMAVLEMWRELRPADPLVHQLLAQNHRVLGRTRDAINDLDRWLELVPDEPHAWATLVDLRMETGELEEAEKAAQQLVDLQPEQVDGWLRLAEVRIQTGALDLAEQSLEKTALLAPGSVDVEIEYADLDSRRGDFDRALSRLEPIGRDAPSPRDRARALRKQISIERRFGRIESAIATSEAWSRVATQVYPKMQQVIVRSSLNVLHAERGDPARARKEIETMRAQMPEPYADFVDLGGAEVEILAEDLDRALAAVTRLNRAVRASSVDALRPALLWLQGHCDLIAGEAERALARADSAAAIDHSSDRPDLLRAQALIELREPRQAMEILDELQKRRPGDPIAAFERARALFQLDRGSEALEALQTTLSAWAEADPDFLRKKRALALKAEITDRS